MHATTRTLAGSGVTLAALLLIAGCSGGGESPTAGDMSSADMAMPSEQEAPAGESARNMIDGAFAVGLDEDNANSPVSRQGPGTTTAEVSAPAQELIRTGEVEIVADDLTETREGIDELLAKYAGIIADEKTRNDGKGEPVSSKLVIRVPAVSFQVVMDSLNEDPDVVRSDTTTEDVTAVVIDVESRLTNLRASLGRLRSFLDDAQTLRALLDYERRITQVESEIASLSAQRDRLADLTSMSTIKLAMRVAEEPPPEIAEKGALDDAGFMAGLTNGWDALVGVALVIATAAGALVPFLIVLVPLVGLAIVVRRRRVRPEPEAA